MVLVPRGALDHFTADLLRAAIVAQLADGWEDVVLDLRELDFMDAGGIHLLEDLRDGTLGAASFSMLDGVAPVALPLDLIGGPRMLPRAELD
jgi:anti-anti-sigma factor